MSSIEELRNYLSRRISEINHKISKSNNKIVDGLTLAKRARALLKKAKFEYAKNQLLDFLEQVKDLAKIEEDMNVRLDKLEEEAQELLIAIEGAGYKAERAGRTDSQKGNLYLAPIDRKQKGGERIPVTALRMEIPQPYTEIQTKRQEQDQRWGGAEHDDTHSPEDWAKFIDKQMTQLYTDESFFDFRDRMIDVAALAVAAIESYDRKKAEKPSHEANSVSTSYIEPEPEKAIASTVSATD